MSRKFLLFLLSCFTYGAVSYAQDPSVGGIGLTPNPLITGASGTIQANFGNSSSDPIPQAANTTYTINLPPNIGVTGYAIVASVPPASTTANLSVSVGAYSSIDGTIVTVISNLGAVPGNARYDMTINVIGVRSTTANAPASINANATGVGTNLPTNDNASTTFAVTGPNPVGLVSFDAEALEDRTVQLNWVTSLETNNKGFVVERSKDLKSFEKVGEVSEIAPNSSAKKHYSLLDRTPFAGTSYYRLTQIDLSGKRTTYPVKSVVLREGAYGVFPNPVVKGQQFMLNLDEPETAVVSMFGSDGRVLPLQKAGVQSGSVLLRTTGTLSTGIYIVTVEERGQSRQHRIVVE